MQWNALDSTDICSGSAAYGRFQVWVKAGVFATCGRLGLLKDSELDGIDWDWRALDSATTKASLVMALSFSPAAGVLRRTGRYLPGHAAFRLWPHYRAFRPIEIGR
jgi:hypothetical protein